MMEIQKNYLDKQNLIKIGWTVFEKIKKNFLIFMTLNAHNSVSMQIFVYFYWEDPTLSFFFIRS